MLVHGDGLYLVLDVGFWAYVCTLRGFMFDFGCTDFGRMLVHCDCLCLIVWCAYFFAYACAWQGFMLDFGCTFFLRMLVHGGSLCLILGVRILGVCLYMARVYA